MEAKQPLPVNRKRIASRVEGRKAAGDLLEFLEDERKGDRDFMLALMETISQVCDLSPKPEPPKELEPIGRLGATLIPFGQHCGKDFDGTPIDYLDWLCREQEGFYKRLRDYLKHPELESRRRGL